MEGIFHCNYVYFVYKKAVY